MIMVVIRVNNNIVNCQNESFASAAAYLDAVPSHSCTFIIAAFVESVVLQHQHRFAITRRRHCRFET